MKTLEENFPEGSVLGCSSGWTLVPFSREFEKQNPALVHRLGQEALSELLRDQDVSLVLCSPDRLIKDSEFELALPVGEVLVGSANLAYLTIENCDEFKSKLSPRISALKEIFSQANLQKSDDLRAAAAYIWDASKSLAEPRFKKIPFLNLNGGCGSYASLARILYRLLFGANAYETNEMMQGSAASFKGYQGVCLDLKQGREGLTKRSQYHSVIDLVDLWMELTEMPFVASVLQKGKRSPSQAAKQQVIQAAELAQARMKVEPSSYLPDIAPLNSQGQRIDLSGVWKQLNYRLVAEDFRSLMFYLHLAKPLLRKPMDDDAFKIKMIRWQEREASAIH
ncbi:MqnA/MqnD/SBP family protein [Pseudobacteriovorax antillogorgiicola]|uniref:Uncharacterized protein n=1 Tax=Pseudobacteriovorax antillogorgiicola TaxID=1513793 RepID=A0A1Y6BCQ2_9BACT|nr:MqnA/MqnD/SBP family protein [Pseudobacteriovorax antillogorgiicola]TCS58601.1 hypothetical protein EDD56_102114 [Pseudobacteriovorax antillogorgiicola]SME97003.1 hypothetical protein SAMN06296036_102329 [Pseudobacteriovorax antillogorgiicola]